MSFPLLSVCASCSGQCREDSVAVGAPEQPRAGWDHLWQPCSVRYRRKRAPSQGASQGEANPFDLACLPAQLHLTLLLRAPRAVPLALACAFSTCVATASCPVRALLLGYVNELDPIQCPGQGVCWHAQVEGEC